MSLLPPWAKLALLVGLLAGALGALLAFGEWRADTREREVRQVYDEAIAKQKIEAAALLADAIRKTMKLERDLDQINGQLEATNAKNQRDAAAAERRIADLMGRNAGRLRDPNAAGCGSGGGGAAPQAAAAAGASAPGGAETGGLLSAQLSRLLQRLQREADEVNNAYAVCRPWAIEVHDKINEGAGGP